MTTDAAPTAPPEEAKRDARCIRCGYDLRGHDVGGRCPECGLRAHWSLKAPVLLSQYPATWVVSVARGVKLLAAAYVVVFVILILAIAGAMQGHEVILFGTLLLAALLQAAGAWMLAASSHHWSEPRSPINRFLLRFSSFALPLCSLGGIWLAFGYRPGVAAGSVVLLIVSVSTPMVAFIRVRNVARMISDADLMEHSALVAGGFIASAAAGVALYLFVGFSGNSPSATWVPAALFFVLIALLLFLLWGAFLMFCCILDFGQAARIAMADWRNDDEEHSAAAGNRV